MLPRSGPKILLMDGNNKVYTKPPNKAPAIPSNASIEPSPSEMASVPGQYPNIAIPAPKIMPPIAMPPNRKGLICQVARPSPISTAIIIAPIPIATAIALATAKFSRVAIPLITLYRFSFAYCSVAPNKKPRIKIKTFMNLIFKDSQKQRYRNIILIIQQYGLTRDYSMFH